MPGPTPPDPGLPVMPTALIVEDEPEANRLLSLIVGLRGYQADSAHTAAEAQDALSRRVPDVIFLDLMLPDRSGYDLCRDWKARGDTSEVPVVIVSASLAEVNRARSFEAGALGYIAKPYTPQQVFDALAVAEAYYRERAALDGQGGPPEPAPRHPEPGP